MNLSEMDKDLSRYDDFEQLSNRVPYWERRLKLTKDVDRESFDNLVGEHSRRVLGVFRAG